MYKQALAAALALGLCATASAADITNAGENRYAVPSFEPDEDIVVNTKEEKQVGQGLPIEVQADKAEYDSVSGDFEASGNVIIKQGQDRLLTSHVHGNMKTGDVWLEQGGTIKNPQETVSGKWIRYNFNNKTGEIKEVKGQDKKNTFSAPHGIIEPEKTVLDEGGTLSRCPAEKHPPCLSVKAKRFTIYPKDKMVAEDVQVFVRGKHIYSRDRWVNYLGNRKASIMPRLGLSDSKGASIRLDVEYDFSEKTKASADVKYYSKDGFKPMYQVTHDERNFNLAYKYGWEEDDDTWYKKQNDFRLDYKKHYLINGVPLSYSAYISHGLWKQEHRNYTSWHTEYAAFLRHDPIHLFNSKNTVLNLTYGKKWVHESRTGETISTNLYYADLAHQMGKEWKIWAGYYREDETSGQFQLDQPDMAKELRNGIQYQPDDNNIFTIINRYDLGKHNNYETNYRWLHKFCCWAIEVEYQDEHYKNDNSIELRYYFYNL